MGKGKHTPSERISEAVERVEREVEVINELGMHLRAASEIVKVANKFQSLIHLIKDDEAANAKSVLNTAALAAPKGTRLKLVAEGPDAGEAVEAIDRLFKDRFGEER